MTCYTKAELENMLEDVVNELDLSDEVAFDHGEWGTPPAALVRDVLAVKDRQMAMLKAGLVDVLDHATKKQGHENGAERLCRILYGRSAEIGDTIGGLDAQMLHDAAAELERAGWRDIATAPRDGSAFQAWLTGAGSTGWWEPICNFGPSGRLGVWRRIDGRYDFDYSLTHITATHWMPRPSCPTPGGAF
jgi:hypothetical protein